MQKLAWLVGCIFFLWEADNLAAVEGSGSSVVGPDAVAGLGQDVLEVQNLVHGSLFFCETRKREGASGVCVWKFRWKFWRVVITAIATSKLNVKMLRN